ncbi:MAG TPA: ATP-binding protein [Vicinamibacterales bacterium]
MSLDTIVHRLAAHRLIGPAPVAEREWFAAHATLRMIAKGKVVATTSAPMESLWILLSGQLAISVNRGAGLRKEMEWLPGDLGGALPFSRMTAPPGNMVAEEATEVVALHRDHFPALIRECPQITAICVHVMVDRARHFRSGELRDEKMISLGRLAAGLAHELNNPTSAVARSANLLPRYVSDADGAARALGAARLTPSQLEAIDAFRDAARRATDPQLTPIEKSDREDAMAAWLDGHHLDASLADALVGVAVPESSIEQLARDVGPANLETTIRYVAADHATSRLTMEIVTAAERISSLVLAVKRFTYLDQATAPKLVDVGQGLRDTLTILAAKARQKSVSVSLDLASDLKQVPGFGGELNQVWTNLIDNAIDAVPQGGHVAVSAANDGDHVAVRVVDDGPGMTEDVRARIFEPFFTTKAVGEGTGLGLDIVHRIINDHGGTIDVASRPGQTAFTVKLFTTRTTDGGSPAERGV